MSAKVPAFSQENLRCRSSYGQAGDEMRAAIAVMASFFQLF
jgi:hypothetical protein